MIHDNIEPERMTLWDSKERGATLSPSSSLRSLRDLTRCRTGGRPDVMKLIKEAYVKWGAEVVFITSNFQGNQEMMEGCKAAGIPAFVGISFRLLVSLRANACRFRERFGITSFCLTYTLAMDMDS